MFTFLNSIIFSLAFAILIPLIIHLFNRQKKVKKDFSSIRFLKILEKKRLNRINIYQYLLIIIRTLIVTMLILAFSRPTVISDLVPGGGSARTTGIIVLDTGFNMRYYDDFGMRFDRAIDRLKDVLKLFNPDDQIFLLLTHNKHFARIDSVNIEQIKCSYMPGVWRELKSEIVTILNRFPNQNQEVYIISDNIGIPATVLSLPGILPSMQQYVFQIGDKSFDNISIDSLGFISELYEPLQPIQIQVTLSSLGIQEENDIELNLYLNDRRESYQRVKLAPGDTKTIQMAFQPKEFGHIEGLLEINEDAFDVDNRYFFNLNLPEKIEILFVDQNPSLFLISALKTIELNSNIKFEYTDFKKWATYNLDRFDKIFLSNFSTIDNINFLRLEKYMNRGGRLILMPGFDSTPNDVNHLLKNLNSETKILGLSQITNHDNYYRLEIPSENNPLLRNLIRSSKTAIDNPHFYKYFDVKLSRKATSLLEFSNRDPFLIFEKNKTSYTYLFTSYIDEDWTDIQFKGIFIPLLIRILVSDNYDLHHQTNNIKIGSQFTIRLQQYEITDNYSLRTPENLLVTLNPEIINNIQELKVTTLNFPGNYKILAGDRIMDIISANVKSSELVTKIKRLNTDSAKNSMSVIREDEQYTEKIKQARTGFELWKLFVILTLLLIAAEFYFIKKIEK